MSQESGAEQRVTPPQPEWPSAPCLAIYDIELDEVRPATQADLDKALIGADSYGDLRKTLQEFLAAALDPENPSPATHLSIESLMEAIHQKALARLRGKARSISSSEATI